MRAFKTLALAAALCFASAGAATLCYAQGVDVTPSPPATAPVDTTVDFVDVWAAWAPVLMNSIGAVVAAIAGWLAIVVKSKFNIDIEARHREAFQSAVTNAAGLLIGKVGDLAGSLRLDVRNPVVAESIEYVLKAAPDALKYFGLFDPDEIGEKIIAKAGVIAATNTPMESVNVAQVGGTPVTPGTPVKPGKAGA